MNQRYLWMLSAGHLFTDLNQGALPAMLPFLIADKGLSYAEAAGLVFAASFASSIIQPIFGLLADKITKTWLMPLGLLLAGAGLSVMGLLTDYWSMFAAVTVSGIGIAAFHPEAARLANKVSGDKKGSGISIFSVGGNAGFALGPIIATSALWMFGMRGTLALLPSAIIMTILLFSQSGKIHAYQGDKAAAGAKAAADLKDDWGSFSRLTVAIICRSIAFQGLNTFLPLYWVAVLHQSKAVGGTALSIMFTAGAVSTLLGGALADRYGYTKIVRFGFTLCVPLLYIFTTITDSAMATAILIPIAFTLFSIFSPMVVLGQKYLPTRLGLASGITMGLVVSVGGMTTPLIGWYADQHGLANAIHILAVVPVLGAIIAYTLPTPGQMPMPARPAVVPEKAR